MCQVNVAMNSWCFRLWPSLLMHILNINHDWGVNIGSVFSFVYLLKKWIIRQTLIFKSACYHYSCNLRKIWGHLSLQKRYYITINHTSTHKWLISDSISVPHRRAMGCLLETFGTTIDSATHKWLNCTLAAPGKNRAQQLVVSVYMHYLAVIGPLTHWGRDKMDAISQTTFGSAFSWMKMFEFRLKFQWSLFLRVQLTIF